MINNFHFLTDSGEKLERNWWRKYEGSTFPVEKKVITGAEWDFNGATYRRMDASSIHFDVLPDAQGLIDIAKGENNLFSKIIVYDGDLRKRFTAYPPLVSNRSAPSNSFFYYIRFLKDNSCECLFNDGHDEYVGDLNKNTGEISNIKKQEYKKQSRQ